MISSLLARFVRLAGFSGLMVSPDELVNLYKMANTQARNSNYEQLLRMLNDAFQGSSVDLGSCWADTRVLARHAARPLQLPCAAEPPGGKHLAGSGLVDMSGPVIRLSSLTPEDFFVLLQKLRHVRQR